MRSRSARALLACGIAASSLVPVLSQGSDPIEIRTLSNRADLLSEGDALVEITIPDGADPSQLQVDLNGDDISAAFAERAGGRILGLVDGLALGANTLTATLDGDAAALELTNHDKSGPIFSGEQIQPWLCTTASNGLGEPQDAACNAPTRVVYHYKSTSGGGLRSYDPAYPPGDVATTTTDDGETVPFIVREETGTQNRGIYKIAVLADPSQPLQPWARYAGWTGKVSYPFGASCGTVHSQGTPSGVLNEAQLARGFLLANSSLNVLGSNCNTVTSAESTMMLKEHIVDHYGEIRFVIGSGCSGGSIGQHMVANAYPGLLDGIQPTCSYMDTWTTGLEVADCYILDNYFTRTSPHLWLVAEQRAFVDGHATPSSCVAWDALFAPVLDPRNGCGLPAEDHYDPETNPDGCRGTLADYMVSVVGRRTEDGFAKLAYDNVGVQYGLRALNDGRITIEQFLDLNEKVGSIDIDANFVQGRRVADEGSARTLYQSGQVNDGGSLDNVAIIDIRGSSNLEIHTDWHSYGMKQRLYHANGHADNHAVWHSQVALVGDPGSSSASFDTLDAWLTAAEADTAPGTRADKIARNRPPRAVDSCWVATRQVFDPTVCRATHPYWASPRIAAGGPLTHDVIQCQRKPLDRGEYQVSFSDAQWERMESIFADGVCDYAKRGIDQVPSIPWMTFEAGPGGQPLGEPPASQAM